RRIVGTGNGDTGLAGRTVALHFSRRAGEVGAKRRVRVQQHAHPHTSCAVSTTSRSFAICCSSVSTLPSWVDEKPHCGDRQSWPSGTYFAASSMRRFSISLLSG